MEVKREDEFSPLKNKRGSGRDCPETARAALTKLHGRYILEAGGKFITQDGKEICDVSRYKTCRIDIFHTKTYQKLNSSLLVINFGHVNILYIQLYMSILSMLITIVIDTV